MKNEIEVIVDGQVVRISTENEESRRKILLSLFKSFKRELIIRHCGKVICTTTVDDY